MRTLENQSVVITGASSGIGRATAHAFARHGARLVLAARRKGMLRDAVRECEELGGGAIAVPTDVTEADDVRRLADEAAERCGGIDVWVNNAGVGLVGRFQDAPITAHKRVVETNLFGAMHGAHAVLPHFLRQERGVLINTVSLGAWIPTPFAAAYTASKAGLRGFTESLRQELIDWPDIHVCGVYPTFVDTPGLHHGANYTGHELGLSGPMQNPEQVARAIVDLALRPRRERVLGAGSGFARLAHAVAPGMIDPMFAWVAQRHFRTTPAAPTGDGNLFEPPSDDLEIRGGLQTLPLPASATPWVAGLAVLGLVAAGAWARRGARGH